MSFFNTVLEKIKYINFLKQERGAIFVLTALLLPVVLGCMGFAYDFGNLYMHKARLQNAADAAALTGARAFVDENAAKRKLYKDEYKSSNHVTTIPADAQVVINQNAKADAKAAAKNAAVANVNQNMINLHNNEYQSSYFLITGVIHEAGKDYDQQYFRANLRETVPLHFLPVIMDKKEQDVAAEAISTIIGRKSETQNKDKDKTSTAAQSLFMVKSGITFENTYASNGSENQAPEWSGYYDGDLRYVGNEITYSFHDATNGYEGYRPYNKLFNSRAFALKQLLEKMSGGYNESDYNALINAMKGDKNLYSASDNTATPEGAVLFAKLQDFKDAKIGYQAVYNAFYDEFASNTHYHSSFQKLEDYEMDSFGVAIKKLFKDKLETGQSDEEALNAYNEAHNRWLAEKTAYETAHQQWVTDKNAAQVEAQNQINNSQSSSSGGGLSNLTPLQVYNMLSKYKTIAEQNNWDIGVVWNAYVSDYQAGNIFAIDESVFKNSLFNIMHYNWPSVSDSSPLQTWPTGTWPDTWDERSVDRAYVWKEIQTIYSAGGAAPTFESLMSRWLSEHPEPTLSREPKLDDFKHAANGDEYYAQYNGPIEGDQYQLVWNSDAISKPPYAKEHSYFYYTGINKKLNNQAFGNFTLNIDKPLYVGGNITTETPFYLFLADRLDGQIIINLETDLNRPLIVCYMGNKATKIDLKLNGHTFRGIMYTPNSNNNDVMLHSYGGGGSKKGTFEGTWMSDALHVKDGQGYYKYVGYDLEDSLDAAMPGYNSEEEEHGNDGSDEEDDPDDNNNPIKVIKLVKKVEEIKTIEEIN